MNHNPQVLPDLSQREDAVQVSRTGQKGTDRRVSGARQVNSQAAYSSALASQIVRADPQSTVAGLTSAVCSFSDKLSV